MELLFVLEMIRQLYGYFTRANTLEGQTDFELIYLFISFRVYYSENILYCYVMSEIHSCGSFILFYYQHVEDLYAKCTVCIRVREL